MCAEFMLIYNLRWIYNLTVIRQVKRCIDKHDICWTWGHVGRCHQLSIRIRVYSRDINARRIDIRKMRRRMNLSRVKELRFQPQKSDLKNHP